MKKRKAFLLRISPDLYQQVEEWAQQELRSVNGQIEFLLKESVSRRSRKQVEPSESTESADENP